MDEERRESLYMEGGLPLYLEDAVGGDKGHNLPYIYNTL